MRGAGEMKYFIESKRLGLKKLDSTELQQCYCDWLNTPKVTRFLVSGRFPSNMEDIASFISTANSEKRVTFAIYLKDVERHIGNVKLDNIDWISRKADFGIMIGDTQQWGMGYGSEATRLVVDYGFSVLNLERIYLGVLKDNFSAIRTYEKMGFIKEGCRQRDQYVEGRFVDSVVMGITRAQWAFKRKRIVAIIQARTGASRLPEKTLKHLLDKPIFVHVFERVSRSKQIHEMVIATSSEPSDDRIADICKEHDITCFRGDLNDGLSRYHEAACSSGAEIIVRITADCPLIDPEIIDRTISFFANNIGSIDYTSNIEPPTFPDGLDVEVFTFEALDEANKKAVLISDREHVTPYMRKHMKKATYALLDKDYSNLRWTVDTKEDFEVVETIYKHFGSSIAEVGMNEILGFLEDNPGIRYAAPSQFTGTY